jgi:hypothetical protein
MTADKKPIDWGGVETDYCAGEMAIREIGRWYGVDPAAIRKKAKKHGWQRKAATVAMERDAPARPPVVPVDPADVPQRARELAGRMVGELDVVTAHHGELEDMICAEESDPRRRAALLKAISLPERAMTLKNLSQTLKTLNEAGEVQGKKAQRQANAEKSAATGRFATPTPPKLVVNNR